MVLWYHLPWFIKWLLGSISGFSLKHKENQILPATTEKMAFCLFKKTALCPFRL